MTGHIAEMFRQAGCSGQLCVQSAAFPPPAKVAAKSGSLIGVVRNEAGVIEYPDGRAYCAAVLAQAHQPWHDDAAINAVIGSAAAAAVGMLSGRTAEG